ncbi:MAG: hypothetical protein ACXW4T_07045 [Candidatus Limnocylindrales bacterium]
MRLAMAHVDLAKAEAKAIGGEVAKVAAYVGIAIAVMLFAGILLVIGTSLFVGEWLLGSMGWGVLHGLLLFTAIAVACALAALGVSGGRIGRSFAIALLLAIIVAVLLATALPNQGYARLGEQVLPGIEPGIRPLVVGLLIWVIIGVLLGLIAATRVAGTGARGGAMLGGAVIGALVGAMSALDVGPQVGAGVGIATGYITWIVLMAVDLARTGVDVDALKARFYPTQTIETSKETLAWLQSKMPPGNGS